MEKEFFHKIYNLDNQFFKTSIPYIIIFIIGLLLSIGVSHPQYLFNDEWITGNQLNQLDQGHQFVVNEGKFGSYQNGTPGDYFQFRNNLLGYPIFFPLISLPALKIIKLFGDAFDYWLFTGWSILLIILGLLIQKCHPRVAIFNRIPLSTLLIVLGFFFFILNMIFYLPFTISPDNSPRETAALILTNDLFFAGVVVVIFSILCTMFRNRWYTWFGTLICVANSSYLIWTSSAKDHMLEIFLFSLVIFGVVKFLYTKKIGYCFFSFLLIGLLAWDRPEIGLFLLFFLFIALIPYFIRQWKISKMKRSIGYLLISPLFTAIGAIPFFINNYIVSKNPLATTYSVWNNNLSGTIVGNASYTSVGALRITENLASIVQIVFLQVSPHFDTFNHDLIGILFMPEIGSIGVLILVPVFLVGLLSIPMLMKYKVARFSVEESYLIIPLLLLPLAFFFAYISAFHILNTDIGVYPDVRYLSPVYLPLNLIGLLILSKFPNIIQSTRDMFKYFIVCTCALIPVFLEIISIYIYQDRNFFTVFFQLSFWMSILIDLTFVCSIFLPYLYLRKKSEKKPFIALTGLLIAFPFIWQIMTIFLISNMVNLFAGYNFFLPIIARISHAIYVTI